MKLYIWAHIGSIFETSPLENKMRYHVSLKGEVTDRDTGKPCNKKEVREEIGREPTPGAFIYTGPDAHEKGNQFLAWCTKNFPARTPS